MGYPILLKVARQEVLHIKKKNKKGNPCIYWVFRGTA
jgi:hypothetical protein